MSTKIIYTDEKWVYYLTNFFSRDQLKSSVLTRTGTIKNGKLLKPAEASKFFGHAVPKYDLPNWVALWIKSDEDNIQVFEILRVQKATRKTVKILIKLLINIISIP